MYFYLYIKIHPLYFKILLDNYNITSRQFGTHINVNRRIRYGTLARSYDDYLRIIRRVRWQRSARTQNANDSPLIALKHSIKLHKENTTKLHGNAANTI